MIRVLIIEGDLRIAGINRRFVEKTGGFEVVGIATDEQQAYEHLEILEPDLVLLDLHFPRMDGLDLFRYIQTHYPLTDVIIITAVRDFDTVREAIRRGVYDFMIKPVVFERFQEKLKAYEAYHRQLQTMSGPGQEIDQEGIDRLLWGLRDRNRDKEPYLPKGIDKLTREKIEAFIRECPEVITAEELGRKAGFSRTTARRYLEYFVTKGEMTADISYGTVGRPERVYKRKTPPSIEKDVPGQ
ncbi:response regulator [Paenibacillus medicaginis]|uniref:Transcriptional regulatory protein n=1 Tax=Paenibacillus medicaginis TaxID=1470560 RepID=A0ABV5C1W0_9BACL